MIKKNSHVPIVAKTVRDLDSLQAETWVAMLQLNYI